jgi:hypothetical protein
MYDVQDIEPIDYFILKIILSFVYFLILLPFVIARLKDAGGAHRIGLYSYLFPQFLMLEIQFLHKNYGYLY